MLARPIAARPNGAQPRILQFPDEAEEAKGVVEEIDARLKKDLTTQPKDFAILFRTNEQPRPFEMELAPFSTNISHLTALLTHYSHNS